MDTRFYPSYLRLEKARWTEADRNMSQFFMEAWANFAKGRKGEKANPTPYALFNTILWQSMEPRLLQYLSVNTTNYTSVMFRDYMQKACQFWNDYVPYLIKQETPTWPPMYEPGEVELRIYRAATWSILASLIVLLFLVFLCSCLYCRAKRYA